MLVVLESFFLSYFKFFHDVKLIGALQGVQFHDFGTSKYVVALQIEPGVEIMDNEGFPKNCFIVSSVDQGAEPARLQSDNC